MTLSRQTKESIKTGLAVTIVYAIAMQAGWEKPYWAVFAAIMISMDTAGQSLNKASLRMLGTLVGAAAALTLLALFPQDRWLFLSSISLYWGFCTYMMTGSRRPYFWFVSAFVCLIIIVDTVPADSQGAFQTAVARVQETAMGILVYSLISLFLWPSSSRGDLAAASRKLLATQHRLYRLYRSSFLTNQGAEEDARSLQMQQAQFLTQCGQALAAARTDSYEVWEVRRQWQCFYDQSMAFRETLERWRASFPEIRQLDLIRFLPGLDVVCAEIDHRLMQVERILAGDAPAPISRSITVSMDAAQVHTLTHFQRAALEVTRSQLERLEQVSRSLFDAARAIKGVGPQTSESIPERTRPQGGGFDPDRFKAVVIVVLALWIGFLTWVYIDPPGHALFMFMCAQWSTVPLMIRQMPSVLVQGFVLGIALAGVVYVFIMPHLSGFGQLGPVLFGTTFVLFYLFWAPSRRGTRTGALATFHVSLGVANEQTYDFAHFANTNTAILLSLAVAIAIPYLFGSPRPEKVFLRLLGRFFRSGEYLISSQRWDPGRRPTRLDRWRMALHTREISTLPTKLRAQLPSGTAQQQAVVNSLQLLSYRMQELLEARARPQARFLVQELLADVRAWRLGIESIFRNWSVSPAGRTAGKVDQRLADRLTSLEQRLCATQDLSGAAALDDDDYRNFYQVLGSYRGLSEALAGYARQAEQIDWAQWREPRF